MKYLISFAITISIVAVFLSPTMSYASVQIVFKNGMSTDAETCDDAGEKFICYKMGGMFEVEKADVAELKETGKATEGELGGKFEIPGKATNDKGTPAVREASSPDQRIGQIRSRKTELMADREKLVSDRQRLQEELSKSPDWMVNTKFDDLKKRISDVDEKVNKFNEEVKRLDAEEKQLRESEQRLPASKN